MNEERRRRSIRLKGYNYSQPGAYFITICTHDRECLFGAIFGGEMQLNDWGVITERCWTEIPSHFPNVALDAFVVMPNHVHGIIVIRKRNAPVGARHAVPLQSTGIFQTCIEQFGRPVSGSIPTIIRSFKAAVTRQINELRGTPGVPIWQRNYYEHVIRDEESLDRIREYVAGNPAQWDQDSENPANVRAVQQGYGMPFHRTIQRGGTSLL
ncbi:MAG: transposase [bacterium]